MQKWSRPEKRRVPAARAQSGYPQNFADSPEPLFSLDPGHFFSFFLFFYLIQMRRVATVSGGHRGVCPSIRNDAVCSAEDTVHRTEGLSPPSA